jgi:uncharacterized protein YbjT (DUF2867 family)
MSDSTILVLGATGSTGRRVTGRLRAAGFGVRAASRSGEVRFDWTDRPTWEPALAGAERMYLMAPHELPVDPALVTLAVEAGVRHIVLLSSRGIEAMGDERLLAAERTVRGSGADWTIVRPDWFDQNFDEGFFHPAVMAGELAVPFGDVKQGFVDADDIAAVATTALTSDRHAGRTYELTGPAPPVVRRGRGHHQPDVRPAGRLQGRRRGLPRRPDRVRRSGGADEGGDRRLHRRPRTG